MCMGELSFQNNVTDPLLAKKQLPSLKFELEKSKGFEKFPRKNVFISTRKSN
jgi:hypothetical protein